MSERAPMLQWLEPQWPAPARVRACTTTRLGGYSAGAYAELNLAAHVGDDPEPVAANRALLADALALPEAPQWLEQVHGTRVVEASGPPREPPPRADAAVARGPGAVCAVLTADCLPVLLCDRAGTCVAAVHAGWRGLAAGVIEAAVTQLDRPGGQLLAWLGPAIGADAYEVGADVRAAFVDADPAAAAAFRPSGERWRADLGLLARQRLGALGVADVAGGQWCTWSDAKHFYSFRRDGVTGRMATLIWLRG